MTLESVQRFDIPHRIVEMTESALRDFGSQGFERFVLWSGSGQESSFQVRTIHIPEQNAYKLESGLCVRVEGNELHRLNRWLFDAGETLAIQIHSHPTTAYHSDTDDAYPIVTQLGGLSLVIPYFCRQSLFNSGWAAYRLDRDGWRCLSAAVAASLVRVVP